MKCQFCANPATVHLTRVVNQQRREVHLCDACAEQQHLLPDPASPAKQELNLPAILNLLIGQHVSPITEELARTVCPDCAIQYMQFRANGRLGCPRDYDVFRAGLEPLLLRVHRSTQHAGKVPKNRHRNGPLQAERIELQRQLRAAIEAEQYEEAARLRDLIRQKECHG